MSRYHERADAAKGESFLWSEDDMMYILGTEIDELEEEE